MKRIQRNINKIDKSYYFYATYKHIDNYIYSFVVKANNRLQIKRAKLHLFYNNKRFESKKDACNYIIYNTESLGIKIEYKDIWNFDVTKY